MSAYREMNDKMTARSYVSQGSKKKWMHFSNVGIDISICHEHPDQNKSKFQKQRYNIILLNKVQKFFKNINDII